ncbi:MAG: flagellar FlbD family protein [Acetivibrionales bacterium]
MIWVTRINNTQLVLNADWIETVESTPDTVITLTNGKKYIVTEKIDEVIERVINYKQKTFCLNRTINTSSINDDK